MNSSFAKNQLEKHGWTEGDGLGRRGNGMSQPIKVNLKMDKTGVGHDPGKEFTDHWWLRAFNNAAKKIKTDDEPNEIEESEESKRKSKLAEKRKSFYKGFVKGSTLTNGLETEEARDSDDEEKEELDKISVPTLDDIHKFCGGATGHRAARFGIKMKGKLGRVAAHDEEFEEMSKIQPGISYLAGNKSEDLPLNDESDESSDKKRRKEKKRAENCVDIVDAEICENIESKKKKKKGKKDRNRERIAENSESPSNVDLNLSECNEEREMKRKQNKISSSEETTANLDEAINDNKKNEDLDVSSLVHRRKAKKKKRKSQAGEEPASNDHTNNGGDKQESKGERKRKRKQMEVSPEESSDKTVKDSENVNDDSKLLENGDCDKSCDAESPKKKKKKSKDVDKENNSEPIESVMSQVPCSNELEESIGHVEKLKKKKKKKKKNKDE